MSTNKYDDWFKVLVRKFPKAEVIEDVLALAPMTRKPRNADYFFEARRLLAS